MLFELLLLLSIELLLLLLFILFSLDVLVLEMMGVEVCCGM